MECNTSIKRLEQTILPKIDDYDLAMNVSYFNKIFVHSEQNFSCDHRRTISALVIR